MEVDKPVLKTKIKPSDLQKGEYKTKLNYCCVYRKKREINLIKGREYCISLISAPISLMKWVINVFDDMKNFLI
jgi:hypothetical protein